MAVLTPPLGEQPGRRPRIALRVILVTTALLVAAALVAAVVKDGGSPFARGSGHLRTEVRDLAPFSRIELAGANTVTVRVGAPQSVAVTADDTLVDRITTDVRDGSLVVAENGDIETNRRTRVTVSIPALDAVTLSGVGTVVVEDVAAAAFTATLSGTGTLKASGTARRVTAVLTHSGSLDLDGLTAADATARLDGTGTIRIRATSTLDATLTGTGAIVYSGDPTVTAHNSGTGSITAQ